MKTRRIMLAAALSLAVGAISFTADAASGQQLSGVVFSPSPGRVGPLYVEGCPGVTGATTWWAAGVTGHKAFVVSSSTWGRAFSLTPGLPVANIDIAFYRSGSAVRYERNAIGGEKGIVPVGATVAFVCLAWGGPTTFVYRAA